MDLKVAFIFSALVVYCQAGGNPGFEQSLANAAAVQVQQPVQVQVQQPVQVQVQQPVQVQGSVQLLQGPVQVQGPVLREKTTILANSAPGTGGHAPNNLVTLVRSADGGYVPGEEPDPPAIRRPSSTVLRSDDTGSKGLVVGEHGQLAHTAQPYQFGYINRNEHGGDYHHEEKSDENNRRTGSYGFRGADGTYRRVEYVADEHGYRAKILTNEQGTSSHEAANALTIAETPPYLQYNPQPAAPAAPVAQVETVQGPAYSLAAPLYTAVAPEAQVRQISAPQNQVAQLSAPQIQTGQLYTVQAAPQIQTRQLYTVQAAPQIQTGQLYTVQSAPQIQTGQLYTVPVAPQIQTAQLSAPIAQTGQLYTANAAPLTQVRQISAPQIQVQQFTVPQIQVGQLSAAQPQIGQVYTAPQTQIGQQSIFASQGKSISAPSNSKTNTPIIHASSGYPAPGLSATAIAASRGVLQRSPSALDSFAPILASSGGLAATPIQGSVGYASTANVLRQKSGAQKSGGYQKSAGVGHLGLY